MSLYSTPDEAKSSHPDVKDAKHYERIYDLLQQSKQALLDSALEKDYNAKNSLTPTMLFVSILVHNGMHPDTAEAVAAMICKTLKLGTVENIQVCGKTLSLAQFSFSLVCQLTLSFTLAMQGCNHGMRPSTRAGIA